MKIVYTSPLGIPAKSNRKEQLREAATLLANRRKPSDDRRAARLYELVINENLIK